MEKTTVEMLNVLEQYGNVVLSSNNDGEIVATLDMSDFIKNATKDFSNIKNCAIESKGNTIEIVLSRLVMKLCVYFAGLFYRFVD